MIVQDGVPSNAAACESSCTSAAFPSQMDFLPPRSRSNVLTETPGMQEEMDEVTSVEKPARKGLFDSIWCASVGRAGCERGLVREDAILTEYRSDGDKRKNYQNGDF